MLVVMIIFISNHMSRSAEILEPLTHLTKEKVLLEWDEDQINALKNMKKEVGDTVFLACPRLDKKIASWSDSSDFQIGAASAQEECTIFILSEKS